MEDTKVIDSFGTSVCSTSDSEPASDLKDNISEAGDADSSWCELPQLIELRTKLQTEITHTDNEAFTLEQEICENRVSKELPMCGTCGLVREPRQRKIAKLRLMHQAMLKKKPKHLLCTAGIITHLESMILEGLLDFNHGSGEKVPRCPNCRQIKDESKNKIYLLMEIIAILKEERKNRRTKSKGCSMSGACLACLNFTLKNLQVSDKIQSSKSITKSERSHFYIDCSAHFFNMFFIIICVLIYMLLCYYWDWYICPPLGRALALCNN